MTHAQILAQSLRELYFGKNWTAVNLKDTLADIEWQESKVSYQQSNTILALVYHIHYYIKVTMPVLDNQEFDAHDRYAFDHPEINSQDEWDSFIEHIFQFASIFADKVEQCSDAKIFSHMPEKKWGTLHKNIKGIVEHGYYHLGQIVLLKKLIRR